MRRDGKFGLSRRLRHCCAGQAHPNPGAAHRGSGVEQLKRCFAAWREMSGVVPQKPAWVPWQPKNCCGDDHPGNLKNHGTSRARFCVGHNYSHCARCSMCRVGDPTKSLKKNRGRLRWKDSIRYADDDFILDFDENAVCNVGGSRWACAVKIDPQVFHRKMPILKDFVVNCPEEAVVFEFSDDPVVVVHPQCPTHCSCQPRQRKRKVSRMDRFRFFDAGVVVPPLPEVEDDWVVF